MLPCHSRDFGMTSRAGEVKELAVRITFRPRIGVAGLVVASLFGLSGALAQEQSCLIEAGPDDSQAYVEQCLNVSMATHPPCNAQNPCELIWNEIARGCAALGEDAPDFCGDYQG